MWKQLWSGTGQPVSPKAVYQKWRIFYTRRQMRRQKYVFGLHIIRLLYPEQNGFPRTSYVQRKFTQSNWLQIWNPTLFRKYISGLTLFI